MSIEDDERSELNKLLQIKTSKKCTKCFGRPVIKLIEIRTPVDRYQSELHIINRILIQLKRTMTSLKIAIIVELLSVLMKNNKTLHTIKQLSLNV